MEILQGLNQPKINENEYETKKRKILSAVEKDCWFWFKNFVYTLDFHNPNEKIRRFPPYAYLELMVNRWQYGNPYLLVAKSRKLLISWAVVNCYLWLAAYHAGEYILFQAQKEEKAGWGGKDRGDPEALLSRAAFTLRNLPDWLQTWSKMSISKKPPMITFTHIVNGREIPSTIHAISSDCEDFRQFTPTGIFADEMGFQDNAARAYGAAMPSLGRNCRYTGVSTFNGRNFFYLLVNDMEW